MTKRLLILCVAGMLSLTTGTAMADSIKNRLGVTGRMGFMVPSDNGEVLTATTGTNTEFIGGGGFMYGITDNLAAEFDITHASEGNFDVTNLTFGLQYRVVNIKGIPELVPYGGGGFDVLLIGAEVGNVDDVVGGHINGGIDYFIRKDLAVNADLKGVFAPNADFKGPGGTVIGHYDPTYFSMTFGVRVFFF